MIKKEFQYRAVHAVSESIDCSIDKLMYEAGKLTKEGYLLQGGISVAISPDGKFYALQTLIKEREKDG